MSHITFYFAPSACSLASHLLLEELGVPYRAVPMAYKPGTGLESADGTINHSEYRKIHPSGYVPALCVDGDVITESPAVLSYLATLAPEKNLAGRTELEKAHTIEWLSYLAGTLHASSYNLMFWPGRFTDAEDQQSKTQEKGRVAVISCYSRIEKALEQREFPVGDAESLVDYYLVPFYHWAAKVNIDVTPYPNYLALVRRMEGKDSAKRVLREESVTPV
ncbi:unnamed protein product [Clonostachys rosea]|uniref:Glutathione S-transferase n=1 Tax=Bionectria ochroleuca TaxID=29856 RepID=A0ABY6UR36_BIOOC|nr:unnamed protein product [Clonostachys rosea]